MRRPPRFFAALAPLLLILSRAGQAAQSEEFKVACPAAVRAEDLQFVRTEAMWSGAIQGPFWLHSAGPMDGPPTDMAVLKEGASTTRKGARTITTWDMSGTFAAGKWMACFYGASNDFVLSKKLDDTTSRCTITRAEQASGKVEIAIVCHR